MGHLRVGAVRKISFRRAETFWKGIRVLKARSLVQSPKKVGTQATPSNPMLSGGETMKVNAIAIRSWLAIAKRKETVSVRPAAMRVALPWLNRINGLGADANASNESRIATDGPGFWISKSIDTTMESAELSKRWVAVGANVHCRNASRSLREAQPNRSAGRVDNRRIRIMEGKV